MRHRSLLCLLCFLPALAVLAPRSEAQLFENLRAFGNRLDVGDPEVAAHRREGPKGICKADFNRDGKADLAVGNLDGTITVYLAEGAGNFAAAQHLRSGTQELRGIHCADVTGDGLADITAAAPFDGKVVIYANPGNGQFAAAPTTTIGARPRHRPARLRHDPHPPRDHRDDRPGDQRPRRTARARDPRHGQRRLERPRRRAAQLRSRAHLPQ